MIASRFLLAAAAAAVASGSAWAQCSNYTLSPAGTVLIDLDDAIYNVALPFPFPFNGNNYSTITVSTNGWIKLGQATATSSQTAESESLMLSDDPRIAVLWDDLNPGPTGSGDLFYSADATQASITWQGVQRFGASQVGTLANCECILTPAGDIYLNYDASCTFNLSNSGSMVGISAGQNLVPAGVSSVDWSTASQAPIQVQNATAYQLFTSTTGASPFDLTGGVVLHFAPTGAATYNVTTVPTLGACAQQASYPSLTVQNTFGAGCPPAVPNGSIYELFTTNAGASPLDTTNASILFVANGETYTTVPGTGIDPTYINGTVLTGVGDETMVPLGFGAMGAFPFGDLLVTNMRLSSNGFIRLDANTANDFSPTAAEFNSQGPRIAGCWKDLNPSIGGTIYFDDTNSAYTMITFENMPEFGTGNTALCTFQIKMFATGDILISHGVVGSNSDNVLVGITRGFALDPGSSDLVTGGVTNVIGPVDIVGVTPMTHTATGGAIGKLWQLSATVTNSQGLGLFIIGNQSPGTPLDGLGGIGCTLYASLDFLMATVFAGSSYSQSIQIPYNPAINGAVLYSQAAAFSTANSFGFVLSNGIDYALGL